MYRLLPLLLALAACGDWKTLPAPLPETGPPPRLLPVSELLAAPQTPPDDGADLSARASALQTRADALRAN